MRMLLRVLLTATFSMLMGNWVVYATTSPDSVCPFSVSANLTPPTCSGESNGVIELIVDGAVGTVEYEWLHDNLPNGSAVGGTLEAVAAGAYDCRVSDGSGCADTISVMLIDPVPVAFSLVPYDVDCAGDWSGAIVVAADESAGELTYSLQNGMTDQTSPVFDNLEAGTYTVTVQNANGCTFEQSATIFEPDSLRMNLYKQDVSCPATTDGFIEIQTTGGSGPYSHSLDGITYTQQPYFAGLEAGQYIVYAKDANECIATEAILIEAPPEPVINIVTDSVSCPGGNDAQMIIIIESGVFAQEDHQFSVNGGAFQSDSVFSALSAGTYDVQIMTPTSCVSSALVTIDEPAETVVDIGVDSVSCPGANDAQMIIIIESGVFAQEDYEFSLNGSAYQGNGTFTGLAPGAYEVFTRDPNSCIRIDTIIIDTPPETDIDVQTDSVSCPGGSDGELIIIIESGVFFEGQYLYSLDGVNYQPDSVFTGLPAGTYTVYVMDPNGCVFFRETTVDEPSPPVVSLQVQGVTCHGLSDGSLEISVHSGASPHDLEFSLDGINYQPDTLFNNLSGGIHTLFIRNGNGCVFEEPFTVDEPEELISTLSMENETCGDANGWTNCEVTGGTAPYTYQWNNGQFDQKATGLSEGFHKVTVTDGKGCQIIHGFFLENEATPRIESTVIVPSCYGYNDGAILLKVISDMSLFTYQWSNGAGIQDLHQISAGEYSVTVTDENGCRAIQDISIQQPMPLAVTGTVNYHNQVGEIVLDVEGGTMPYEYVWSNGLKGAQLTNLREGDYWVTVTDAHGCEEVAFFTLQLPQDPLRDEILIYPVPTAGDLYVDFNLREEKTVSFKLVDLWGRTVRLIPPQRFKRERFNLDVHLLDASLYWLVVELDQRVITRKVVKVSE